MHNNLSDLFYHRLFIVIRQIQAIEIMFVIVKTIASEFFAVAQLQSIGLLCLCLRCVRVCFYSLFMF
jgi:hypothetical protein